MTSPAPIVTRAPAHGVLVVAGYGVRIAVERSHLLIEDGTGADRQQRRLSRVSPDVRRLLVFGHAGTVSLDAIRWLHDVGIAFAQIDNDGTLLNVGSVRALDDVRVRRGQALAPVNGVALTVAKSLIGAKIDGQARIASQRKALDALRWLKEANALLPDSMSVDDVRFIESKAAAAYWDAWEGLPIHFAPRDARSVPSHWMRFSARRSVLSRSPRKATDPANALLNYLYAVLEAEARIAVLRVGGDPGMGVLHVDSTRRDSFACDLMEAVRPDVDAYVLDLLHSHTFSRADFFETTDGNCRLMPSIARPLAATAPRWAKRLAPFAERAAAAFAAGSTLTVAPQPQLASPLPARFRTPLTQRNRSASRPEHRQRTQSDEQLQPRCRGCGVGLGTLNRTFCDACLDQQRASAAVQARSALSEQRMVGQDRRSSADVRTKRRSDAARQMRDIGDWEAENGTAHDAAGYSATIAPRLRGVPTRALVHATGLSVIYCRQLRRGERIPHPRHWEALGELAEQQGQAIPEHWDTAFYLREIAPKLAGFTPQQIANATGLSVPYCKRVRRGRQLPRQHHWPALARLVST